MSHLFQDTTGYYLRWIRFFSTGSWCVCSPQNHRVQCRNTSWTGCQCMWLVWHVSRPCYFSKVNIQSVSTSVLLVIFVFYQHYPHTFKMFLQCLDGKNAMCCYLSLSPDFFFNTPLFLMCQTCFTKPDQQACIPVTNQSIICKMGTNAVHKILSRPCD